MLDILKPVIPEGYCILRLLSCYLHLDSLIGLDVHTDRSTQMIKDELARFNDALQVSVTITVYLFLITRIPIIYVGL